MKKRNRRTSVLLSKEQIEFLTKLAKRIEKESGKKISRCRIMNVLTKTLACIGKVEIGECRSEEEMEKHLLKCFKRAVKELER